MAAPQAADMCDCVSVQAEETERLYDFLEAHQARPSLQGQGWVRDHWFRLQSVIDRMKVLQKEATVKRGKGKVIICAVLGVSLAAAVEERNQRSGQAEAVVDSLQVTIETLQEQLRESKWLLEEERCQNVILKEELRNQLRREADSLAETEVARAEKGIRSNYPQGDLKGAKETAGSPPNMYPLLKTEFVYEDDGDNRPQVITKEIPFAATELAKLQKDFARTARESETEYVWRVSLSGGERDLVVGKGSGRVLGPGRVLNHRRSPSLVVADSEDCVLGGGFEPAGEGGSPGHNGHNRSVAGKCAESGLSSDDV